MNKFLLFCIVLFWASMGYAQTPSNDANIIKRTHRGATKSTVLTEAASLDGYIIAAGMVDLLPAPGVFLANRHSIVLTQTDYEFQSLSSDKAITLPGASPEDIFEPKAMITLSNQSGYVLVGQVLDHHTRVSGGFFLQLDLNLQVTNFTEFMSDFPLIDIVEVHNGYVAATSQELILLSPQGRVNWAERPTGNQYKVSAAQINDIEVIDKNHVAFTGSINILTSSFGEITDSDVLLGIFNVNDPNIEAVAYEQMNKKFGDGRPAFIETGKSIAVHPSGEIFIVGEAIIREESKSVNIVRERNILTISLNIDFQINRSHVYNVDALLHQDTSALSVSAVKWNPHDDTYVIGGGLRQSIIQACPLQGFMLTIDANSPKVKEGVVYHPSYGDHGEFTDIYIIPKPRIDKEYNKSILGIGDAHHGYSTKYKDFSPQGAWVCEKFETSNRDCRKRYIQATESNWKLQPTSVDFYQNHIPNQYPRLHDSHEYINNYTKCPVTAARPAASTPTQQAAVYQNHQLEVANPDGEYTHYRIMDISGVLRQEGLLQRGDNSLKLQSDLARGLYFFMSYNPETGARSTQKLVW